MHVYIIYKEREVDNSDLKNNGFELHFNVGMLSICKNYHTKWSKSDRERQISYDITDIENKLTVTKGERLGGRDKLGIWE